MKKTIISAIIAATIATGIIAAGITRPAAAAETGNNYPETLYVIDINETQDTVLCRTFSGMLYEFDGVEDWQVDDIVSAIMNDNGTTETITDDYFVDIRYSGWIE